MGRIRRRSWAALVLGGLLASGVALLVWGFVVYVRFVGLQVEVLDASSRVEAVGRSRARLAGNLVAGCAAFAGLDPAPLARLDAAVTRAARASGDGSPPFDPSRFAEFREAQRQLSAALAEVWSALERRADPQARLVVDDFDDRLQRAAALLEDGLRRLDAGMQAYRTELERFPGSLVAALAGLDGRAPLGGVLAQ